MPKRSRGILLMVAVSLFGAGLLAGALRVPAVPQVAAQADEPTATKPSTPDDATAAAPLAPDKDGQASEEPVEISQLVAVELDPQAVAWEVAPVVDDLQVPLGAIHPELDRSPDGWETVVWETFDNNSWHTYWRLTYDSGKHASVWGPDDTRAPQYGGDTDAWTNRAGPSGLDPQYNNYPHNAGSSMTYGPFSLVGATDATLSFSYWLDTEANYDWFSVLASTNGSSFFGVGYSGTPIHNTAFLLSWRQAMFKRRALAATSALPGRTMPTTKASTASNIA